MFNTSTSTSTSTSARATSRKTSRSLVNAVAAVLAVAPLVVAGTPIAAAASCPAVEVVFARGTGQPAGVGPEGQAFVDSVRSQVSGNVTSYAVDYPATDDFVASTTIGANDASAHLQATVANCPETKIVLGGFSQGAAVIDVTTAAPITGLGFTNPLPPEVADHVVAVAVFGNPSNRIGRPLTQLSGIYGSKTIDLCTVNDPVCSSGNDVAAHSLYVQTGLVSQGASFVASRL